MKISGLGGYLHRLSAVFRIFMDDGSDCICLGVWEWMIDLTRCDGFWVWGDKLIPTS